MTLGSTKPLTEMSTRSISVGEKGGRYVGLQTYHHPVPLSLNLGTLSSWNPPDHSRPVMGLIYRYVEFTFSCRVSLTVHAASEILAFSIILCEVLSVVCAAAVAYPGIFFGRGSTNSFADRKQTFTFTSTLY
jgi:hypothetical protein